ncbi:MAG: hypothetical protein HRU19_29330 [Pseudobacteriovorax sp.]|nr:hypothetical protein [Pseudobacteriovorax sp.]NRA68625.1 hypothetical protein [Pseudobacteriovorax sp.]
MRELIDPAMDRIFEVLGEEEDIEIQRDGLFLDQVRGVFCDEGQELENEHVIISSSEPRLLIRESDLAEELSPTDRLLIREDIYRIKDTDQDGYGNLILELFKVGAQEN